MTISEFIAEIFSALNVVPTQMDFGAGIGIEFGLLTILAIFFSFSGIKSILNQEYHEKRNLLKDSGLKQDQLDFVVSRMDKKLRRAFVILESMGRTFRICIYLGIPAILLLILYQYTQTAFVHVIFYFLVCIQLWGVFVNVYRFKNVYELNLGEEIAFSLSTIAAVDNLKNQGNQSNYGDAMNLPVEKKYNFVKSAISDLVSLIIFWK